MYIRVKVNVGAKKEKVERLSKDHFEVSVKEKPERNMANKRVQELLSLHFSLLPREVKMISGHRSPSKIFNLDV